MKKILVINPKGGCGKSTIATNLASYYAFWEVPVALVDYDPQHSSLDWIEARNPNLHPIQGIDGSGGQQEASVSSETKRVIMDAPAGIPFDQLKRLFNFADETIVPVLPSPMDIRAAAHFIGEMMFSDMLKLTRVGLIANRVRENTLIYQNLEAFLKQMKIPLVTKLRDTQNYIHAAKLGHGIFEMAPSQVGKDIEQWRPVITWVEKARS